MIRTLLTLEGTLTADASDALAVAVCHAHSRRVHALARSAGVTVAIAAPLRAGRDDRLAARTHHLKDAAAAHRRSGRRGLRARSADVHVLPSARGRAGRAPAHALRRARGCAAALRLRHRGRARAVPQPAQGVGHRAEDRAGTAFGHQRRSVRACACRTRMWPRSCACRASAARPPSVCSIEMRDRLEARRRRRRRAPSTVPAGASPEAEAFGALVALGYRPAEATRLLKARRSRYTLHRRIDPAGAAERGPRVIEPSELSGSRAHRDGSGEQRRRGGRSRHSSAHARRLRRPDAGKDAARDFRAAPRASAPKRWITC